MLRQVRSRPAPGPARPSRARRRARNAGWTVAALAGAAAVEYAATVGWTWLRYGHPHRASGDDRDPLLDRYMPVYDIVDRQRRRVAAPAHVTYRVAADIDLQGSALVRAIFKARTLMLGSRAAEAPLPAGLVAQAKAMGWGVLAEIPGYEIVMGAVTQPWNADVVFRALAPNEFADFNDPGYVKIVWTLRADPAGPHACVFRTETRAVATDATARSRFRWYWARFSAGIVVIRKVLLATLKADAERYASDVRQQS
jgi:hypothetical protein